MKSICVVVIILGCLLAFANGQSKVKILAVEMSRCPFCASWKVNFQQGVLSKPGLRDIVDLDEQFKGTVNGTDFTCLHGPEECVGNKILLCARNLTISSSPWGWWDLGVCMQSNYPAIPTNAKDCATKANLPWDTINDCATGALGKSLFTASIGVANSLQVKSTPTVYVNGKEYVGGPPNPLGLICNLYTGTKPAGCA